MTDDQPPEEWRACVPGYQVSNHGRVRRLAKIVLRRNQYGEYDMKLKEKELKRTPSCYGYLVVGCDRRQYFVHFLVLEAFGGPKPSDLHQCRHLDGNRQRNFYPGNLAWGTSKENADDRSIHGVWVARKGEDCWQAKISEDQVRQLRAAYKPRGSVHVPLGISFGLSRKAIWNICNRRTWKHVD